jgi:hypothetical protein
MIQAFVSRRADDLILRQNSRLANRFHVSAERKNVLIFNGWRRAASIGSFGERGARRI